MKKNLLDEIIRRAKRDLPKHPQLDCYPHYTFVVRDNKIISVGLNRRHEPPRCLGYHRNDDPSFRPKYHSELDALRRCRKDLLDPYEVVNVRLNKSGFLRIAMPCRACRRVLRFLGCRRAWFTTECGWGNIRLN